LERDFENLDSSNDSTKEKNVIRVMQWNTLARSLCSPNKYTIAPKEAYDWNNYRLWRTIQEIVRYDCDIICLEEVDHYELIKPYLHAIGYTSIFLPKFASPCLEMLENIGPDGCSIFYRFSKFQV
jgi:nocturnin